MLFTIQDDHLDEAEIDRIKQASFDSMFTHSETFEGHSNWMVNDLSLPTKYIGCDPFEIYELSMGVVGWIGVEYQQIQTEDYGIVSAAHEDTDHHHGSVVILYKKDTSISADYFDDFIDCMAEYVNFEDTVEFFDESVLVNLEGAEDEEVIDLVGRIEKQVGIIQNRKSKDVDKTKACKVLWAIRFDKDEITGIWAITRSIRQERALNIEMIDSPLQRKIKADMGHDFEWKKGPLGTVFFVSCPMYLIHYNHARGSPLPPHMPGKFWSCGSTIRLINQPIDYSGAAIQVIEEVKFKPEQRRYNKEDYTVKLLLKLNQYESRMYIECQLGKAINKGVDKHAQLLLNQPNFHQHAMDNEYDYYWGVDEFAKLYARQEILVELEKCKKQMAKQKKEMDELLKYKQKHEKESDEDEIDENKNKKVKRHKKKKNSGESHSDDDEDESDSDNDTNGSSDSDSESDEDESDSDNDTNGSSDSDSDEDEDEDIAELTVSKKGDKEEAEGSDDHA